LEKKNQELEIATRIAASSKESEIMSMVTEKQILEEENKNLRSAVSSIGASAAEKHASSTKEFTKHLELLSARNQQLLDENETLRKDMITAKERSMERVAAVKGEEVAGLSQKVDELMDENKKLRENNEKLEATVSSLNSLVSSAALKEETTSTEHAEAKNEWERKAKNLSNWNQQLLDENRLLVDENENLIKDVESAKAKAAAVDEQKFENAELNQKLEIITKEKEEIENENRELQLTISSAKDRESDFQKLIEETKTKERQEVLSEVEDKLTAARNANAQLEEEVINLEKENKKLKNAGKIENKSVIQFNRLKTDNELLSLKVEDLELENQRLTGIVGASAAGALTSVPGEKTSERAPVDQASLLMAAKREDEATQARNTSWRRLSWAPVARSGSLSNLMNATEDEGQRRELELKIETLEEKAREDKATILKIRSDLVKLNSNMKEESYFAKKQIETLSHENSAYAIKVEVLEKELNELETKKNEGGGTSDSNGSDQHESNNDSCSKDASAEELKKKCASLERQLVALKKEREVLMLQIELFQKDVKELQQKSVSNNVTSSDNANNCVESELMISTLKSELKQCRMTAKAESYRNELELERVKEENRVIVMKLAQVDKEVSNDPKSPKSAQEIGRENRGKSIVQLDAGYVNDLRSDLVLSKEAIIDLEKQLHESQMQEKALQEEIDRLNSGGRRLASSFDDQPVTMKKERHVMKEFTFSQSVDTTKEFPDQWKKRNITQKKKRQDADLVPHHPWRRKGRPDVLDSLYSSASEADNMSKASDDLSLSLQKGHDEEPPPPPPPQDIPYRTPLKMRDSTPSFASRERKGKINNLEDKIFQIAMDKK